MQLIIPINLHNDPHFSLCFLHQGFLSPLIFIFQEQRRSFMNVGEEKNSPQPTFWISTERQVFVSTTKQLSSQAKREGG